MKPFKIEQIAIMPASPIARLLLRDLGAKMWVEDAVEAFGEVRGEKATNRARLSFNYELGAGAGLELELLSYYPDDPNWMAGEKLPAVSHLGMHCTVEELEEYRAYFKRQGILIEQEVDTTIHTNPAIKDSRRYKYVIFGTRHILGVDLKFIVRKEITP